MKVYLISSEINNEILYKIGVTKNDVNKRIKQLKTGNPATLSIVNIFESKWAFKIESNLHKRYKNISGEWFSLNDDEVNNFLKVCEMVHNNFELLSSNNTWYIDKYYK
jgi:hypothetical protein